MSDDDNVICRVPPLPVSPGWCKADNSTGRASMWPPVSVTDGVKLGCMVGQSNYKKCRPGQAYLQAQYRAVGVASFESHIPSLAVTT
jgi:hypothetical protein